MTAKLMHTLFKVRYSTCSYLKCLILPDNHMLYYKKSKMHHSLKKNVFYIIFVYIYLLTTLKIFFFIEFLSILFTCYVNKYLQKYNFVKRCKLCLFHIIIPTIIKIQHPLFTSVLKYSSCHCLTNCIISMNNNTTMFR